MDGWMDGMVVGFAPMLPLGENAFRNEYGKTCHPPESLACVPLFLSFRFSSDAFSLYMRAPVFCHFSDFPSIYSFRSSSRFETWAMLKCISLSIWFREQKVDLRKRTSKLMSLTEGDGRWLPSTVMELDNFLAFVFLLHSSSAEMPCTRHCDINSLSLSYSIESFFI